MKLIKALLVVVVALSAIAQVLSVADVINLSEKEHAFSSMPCFIGFLILMGITHFENKKKSVAE